MTHVIIGHGVSGCFGTKLATRKVEVTRGLGITPGTTSDNLTPPETTNQDSPDMGPDGASLSCPGSSVVAGE